MPLYHYCRCFIIAATGSTGASCGADGLCGRALLLQHVLLRHVLLPVLRLLQASLLLRGPFYALLLLWLVILLLILEPFLLLISTPTSQAWRGGGTRVRAAVVLGSARVVLGSAWRGGDSHLGVGGVSGVSLFKGHCQAINNTYISLLETLYSSLKHCRHSYNK